MLTRTTSNIYKKLQNTLSGIENSRCIEPLIEKKRLLVTLLENMIVENNEYYNNCGLKPPTTINPLQKEFAIISVNLGRQAGHTYAAIYLAHIFMNTTILTHTHAAAKQIHRLDKCVDVYAHNNIDNVNINVQFIILDVVSAFSDALDEQLLWKSFPKLEFILKLQ